ncbi:SagB/ThcOx family dehydrogenase [Prolixibacteraceae bacterium JC049]|nr:SagB/ThcOx family dehydrogenase [Prolixibacteraceae bacterium JC049]
MKQLYISLIITALLYSCSNVQGNQTDATSTATPKATSGSLKAEVGETIKLNKPFENKATLMKALQNRKSTRSFANKPVNKQDLSNLLWAAAGVNRDNGGRTVPLLGDIAIYAAMKSGVYLYEAKNHELKKVLKDDIRAQISSQAPVKKAPVVFIMTIDDASFPGYMKKAMKEAHGMDFYYGNQVAYSTQNIYLYACANNMNAVVIGGFNRPKVDEILDLKSEHHSYLIQLVGYKKE